MYLLELSQIIKVVAILAPYIFPWKNSKNSQLTVVVRFECGCALFFVPHLHTIFLLHLALWDLALVREIDRIHLNYNFLVLEFLIPLSRLFD
jgi:hypothetical protein